MSDGLEASRRRARRNVVLTAAIAGLGGLLFGYDTGVIAGALLFMALRRDRVLTLIFCWALVPETKGKRLEDIQAIFQARVDSRRASA
ncbi:MAG TPA: hypothetical protein VIM28_00045 [Solirubrobacterales bacterium]